MTRRGVAVVVVFFLAACGIPNDDQDGAVGRVELPERWTWIDDPKRMDPNLEYELSKLPLQGEADPIPWAGSYWPVYKDSINVLWDGASTESAAAKYGKAFNITDLEDAVSKHHGIDYYADRTSCTANSDCETKKGETCAKREGETTGRCIPKWWGLCHAWAPAAILEPEPEKPVTINNVTFKVNDIKALVTISYNSSGGTIIGGRCYDSDDDDDIDYDEYGRATPNCRDTNPGTLHVIVANYLGVKKESFVEDRTFDEEVWNQPVRGFKVTKLTQVDMDEANKLVGVTATGGTTDTFSGTVTQDQWSHHGPFTVKEGQPFKAIITGTNDADLYVSFGAQPTKSSYSCRPYKYGSSETCDLTVPAGETQAFVSVHGWDPTSDFELKVTHGATVPTTYVLNTDAKDWYHVKLTLSYITESSISTDGNLSNKIDYYTKKDYYEYVLELDAGGKIIGGEWVGQSKKKHPDFLWKPNAPAYWGAAGGKIKYSQVKQLLDQSLVSPGGGGGGGNAVTVNESGTVTQNQWNHYGPYEAKSGELKVVMTGDSDADLYVREGSQPTVSGWDCRPYKYGSSETCTQTAPGSFYVSVRGWDPTSNYALVITYTE
jgi:hypothetical protein